MNYLDTHNVHTSTCIYRMNTWFFDIQISNFLIVYLFSRRTVHTKQELSSQLSSSISVYIHIHTQYACKGTKKIQRQAFSTIHIDDFPQHYFMIPTVQSYHIDLLVPQQGHETHIVFNALPADSSHLLKRRRCQRWTALLWSRCTKCVELDLTAQDKWELLSVQTVSITEQCIG